MKDMERKLREGLEDLTPDVLPQVLSSRHPKLDHADWEPGTSKKAWYGKTSHLAAILSACLFLVIGISFYQNNLAANATIDLDVNPSIELVTNKKDQILRADALNEEGLLILDGMDLRRADITVGINAIIGSMVRQGYITELQNSILVTVQSQDTRHAEELQISIAGDIREVLSTNQISGDVYYQSADEAEAKSARQLSEQYGISIGKAVFLIRLQEKDPSLVLQDLSSMSLWEIANIIRERNLDITDIAGYEHDDSVEENVEEIIEEQNERKTPSASASTPQPKASERATEALTDWNHQEDHDDDAYDDHDDFYDDDFYDDDFYDDDNFDDDDFDDDDFDDDDFDDDDFDDDDFDDDFDDDDDD